MTIASLAGPRAVQIITAARSAEGGPSTPSPQAPVEAAHTSAATPAPQESLLAPWLLIEFDEAAGRFVQTLVDPSGEGVLRRYPDESQLAFSRGVNAYMQASTLALNS